ncbi:MAG: hypothetical protein ACREFO_17085 [Acetobacteraceae bacterium]
MSAIRVTLPARRANRTPAALPSAEEPAADKAWLLRSAILEETVRAFVPSLWLYEVGNTVARRFPAQAQSWPAGFVKFGLQESPPSQAWLYKSLELTGRHDIMFYDAAYHALVKSEYRF